MILHYKHFAPKTGHIYSCFLLVLRPYITDHNRLTIAGMEKLGQKKWPSLEDLRLGICLIILVSNNIGDEGILKIIEKKLKKLKILQICI